jgi:hypothetical protein
MTSRDADERLEAYRQIVARPPTDGYQRGATLTQPGAPAPEGLWRGLMVAYVTRCRVEQDDARS